MNEQVQEIRYLVGEAWKGEYNPATTYGNANVVQDPTGLSVYRSLKPGNVGHPLTDANWWFCIINLSSIKAESDRIAALNTAIAQDEALRVAAEQQRAQAEQGRVNAEAGRVSAEQGRVSAEQGRVSAEQSRVSAESGRAAAEQQRVSKEQQRQSNEQTRITQEQSRVLAEDQRAVNEENRQAIFSEDHQQAVADHEQAASDHTRANSDHETATSDHGQMTDLVNRADADHTAIESALTIASADHEQAGNDHTRAAQDHTTAAADHTQAGQDHTQADADHTIAAADHQQAVQDHDTATEDHTTYAGNVLAAQTAAENAASSAATSMQQATAAAGSAAQTEQYVHDIMTAMENLPDGQAVSAQVAVNTAAIGTKASQTDLTAEINRAETAEAQIRADLSTMNSVLTLEANSNPAFKVSNHAAAEAYIGAMGGYGLIIKDGKAYAAKLNGDWSGFIDGTPITDASKFETMIHVPKCNFKGNGKTLTFGGLTPIDGGKSFDSPEWVGAYEMYVDGNNKGHSRPGVAPAHSKTMSQFWACAQALGTEFGLANYQFFCLINALFQAKYGNLNSQAIIGAGGQTSAWDSWRNVPMGLTKALGDGSGRVLYNDENVGDQYAVKLFGFEDLWGKLWEFRPGIRYYMDGNVRHAVVYPGNQVSNTAEGRDISGVLASASGQYATQMLLGEYWDMICQAVGGGDTTYYCDGYWAAAGGELLYVGGLASYFARCGVAFSSSDHGFSISWANLGSRLAFYGTPQIVSGAELLAMAD